MLSVIAIPFLRSTVTRAHLYTCQMTRRLDIARVIKAQLLFDVTVKLYTCA